MKKFKDLKEGEAFTLEIGSDKMYQFVRKIEMADGTVYYLTKRYSANTGGFWGTSGEKEVYTWG